MADLFGLGDMSPGVINNQDGTSTANTGDLRRRFNFGDRVSELAIAQDPFFRFLSKVSKVPVNDPLFKFTEKRHSFHKRYAYVQGSAAWAGGSAALPAHGSCTSVAPNTNSQGSANTFAIKMGCDYKSAGNITSVIGQSSSKVDIGSAGTAPQFFLVDQLIKIPLKDQENGTAGEAGVRSRDYQIVRVEKVAAAASNFVVLGVSVVRPYSLTTSSSTVKYENMPGNGAASTFSTETYDKNNAEVLELWKSYVIGTAHKQGSGYPETWKDQPYSTNYGMTQIWKTSMAMENTARATELKYEGNEWSRIWREKLIEHKWDIEQVLLFGTQYEDATNGITYTQGAVDYVAGAGNIFSLDTSTKTQDDFLDDMSQFLDPRYNNSGATLFMCDTATYNWLHKLSGYFANNVANLQPGGYTGSGHENSLGRGEFAMTGKGKKFGVDITTISTPYGDMNVTRNIHLDGSDVKILGCNMKYAKYRPLVGNGINRDTTVYVGVQTIENSGVDRRVDLIQTEAGMEWSMPECHVLWK